MRAILLTISLLLGVVGAAQPIAPCTRTKVDTTGWRIERFNKSFVFSLPPIFKRDRTARYQHGGRRWTDGPLEFEQPNGYWGERSFGHQAEDYSECVDTLGGTRFRIITWSLPNRSYYAVALEDAAYNRRGGDMTTILIGNSPNRSDQRRFLAIFRTLRLDSTTPWGE